MLFQFEVRIYYRLFKLIVRGKIGTSEVRFDLFTPATSDILTEKKRIMFDTILAPDPACSMLGAYQSPPYHCRPLSDA